MCMCVCTQQDFFPSSVIWATSSSLVEPIATATRNKLQVKHTAPPLFSKLTISYWACVRVYEHQGRISRYKRVLFHRQPYCKIHTCHKIQHCSMTATLHCLGHLRSSLHHSAISCIDKCSNMQYRNRITFRKRKLLKPLQVSFHVILLIELQCSQYLCGSNIMLAIVKYKK